MPATFEGFSSARPGGPIRSRTTEEQTSWPNRGAFRETSSTNLNRRDHGPIAERAEMLDPEELPW
ncbi:hypothetical protein M422DRAFT_246303 [Sphaerobolus stellatus SS14]|nr:hypothetical protein M422DRAFT_246303 [Sphaerobolus stellatus SS14]